MFFYSWSSSEKSNSCSFSCVSASRADLHTLEIIRKKLVSWITGNETRSYLSHLRILNIMLQPMFLQLNHIPLWSRITHKEVGSSVGLPKKPEKGGKKVKFPNCEERSRLSKKWVLQKLQTRKWTGQLYWLHEPAKTEKQTFKFDSINRKILLAKLGNIVAEEFV